MNSPKCVVCGKPIKKRFHHLSFSPATGNHREPGERQGSTMFLDLVDRPETKEAAQRYTNHAILSVVMTQGKVYSIKWWEGDYEDKFFCTQTCARKQGYASANHGQRYTWS